MNRLPKAQAAMLGELLTVYPESLSVDELADRTGYWLRRRVRFVREQRLEAHVAELIRGDRHALYAADAR